MVQKQTNAGDFHLQISLIITISLCLSHWQTYGGVLRSSARKVGQLGSSRGTDL